MPPIINLDDSDIAPLIVTTSSNGTKAARKKKKRSNTSALCVLSVLMITLGTFLLSSGVYLINQQQQEQHVTNNFINAGRINATSTSSSFFSEGSISNSFIHDTLRNFVIGMSSSDHDTIPNSEEKTKEDNHDLPQWIVNYVRWHNKMRQRFPGPSLITHPDSPGVLLRWCGGLCGGLHDRLGQLPLDLYIANQTRRVLLIRWERPHPLESFFLPPSDSSGAEAFATKIKNNENTPLLSLDWRFPSNVLNWTASDDIIRTTSKMYPAINNIGGERGDVKLPQLVEDSILFYGPSSLSNTNQQKEKLVLLKVMGHLDEEYLESKLKQFGETDMIHGTKTFGRIWNMFFQLSDPLKIQLSSIMDELRIKSNEYTAVHCRVRHPKAFKAEDRAISANGNIDKTGLPFEAGPARDFAVRTALHAIKCSTTLLAGEKASSVHQSYLEEKQQQQSFNKEENIYFMSDSNDLVEFMVRQIKDEKYISQHPSMDVESSNNNDINIYKQARELVQSIPNIKSRDNSKTFNAHIDKQKNKPLEAYYGAFLDLYLAIHANCVSYGIGFFAVFAAKISGTTCKVQYTKEEWGEQTSTAKTNIDICTPKDYEGLI